jgi:hypothetical protein
MNSEPRPLTLEEIRAKEILEHHRGRANALQVRHFAQLVGVDERRAQILVKHLVEDHGVLIGSAVTRPFGYYIPETPEEVRAVTAQLYHRIASLAVRIARIKRISVEEVYGQMRLDTKED